MEIDFRPGKYVVAVSGGVDSMVLLDLLRQKPGLELVIAHLDHGIRSDSSEDRQLVERAAAEYDLPFYFEEARLGPHASEAAAREARYGFLRHVKAEQAADAIVTAHHQDDVLETVILNLLRGTGRKGLSSLKSTDEIRRPLLGISKAEIRDYAQQHDLQWREDSTNRDESVLRNYVRRRLLPRLSEADKGRLIVIIGQAAQTNAELDEKLTDLLPLTGEKLPRQELNGLTHSAAKEVMAAWLRAHDLRDFDRLTIERLVVAAKTAEPGKRLDVLKHHVMYVTKAGLALAHTER